MLEIDNEHMGKDRYTDHLYVVENRTRKNKLRDTIEVVGILEWNTYRRHKRALVVEVKFIHKPKSPGSLPLDGVDCDDDCCR